MLSVASAATRICQLTLVENVAEDRFCVYRAAVPPPILELKLALSYGFVGSCFDGVHHLDVTSADLDLPLDQPHQVVTRLLFFNMVHGSDRGNGSESRSNLDDRVVVQAKRDYKH